MQWELIERAKEELEILESEHPNKFECLKMELKAFISDFELQLLNSSISMSSAATQESSSKREKVFFVGTSYGVGMSKKRKCKSKTDAVLEKLNNVSIKFNT